MAQNVNISVVMPVFNAAATLCIALDSLVNQTLNSIEVLCIDDGSTDASSKVLESYAAAYSDKVIVRHTQNKGSFAARELGLQLARGEFVAFCDADDSMAPHALESMFAKAKETGSDVVVSGFRRIDSAGGASDEMCGFGSGSLPIDSESGWLVSINTSLWNKLIKRSLVEERIALRNPPRIAEDALLLFSLYEHANKMAFVPEPLYDYRFLGESAMGSITMGDMHVLADGWSMLKTRAMHDGFSDIIDLAAMVHIGVSAPLIAARKHSPEFSSIVSLAKKELDDRFPSYRNSRFTSRSYVGQFPSMRKVRVMETLLSHGLLPAGLKAYCLASSKLKLSAGW